MVNPVVFQINIQYSFFLVLYVTLKCERAAHKWSIKLLISWLEQFALAGWKSVCNFAWTSAI